MPKMKFQLVKSDCNSFLIEFTHVIIIYYKNNIKL